MITEATARLREQTRSNDRRDVVPLGARLRADTLDAHRAAERAFDLPRRLASVRAYGEALLVLDAFARACGPALAIVAPSLPAVLRDGPTRRATRLAADLRTLRLAPGGVPAPLLVGGPDQALGVWYVQEGAALGGLLIAAEVRRRLPAAIPATTFFAGEGAATARRWRDFQKALGEWAGDDPDAHGRVVAGARQAFTALTSAMTSVEAAA